MGWEQFPKRTRKKNKKKKPGGATNIVTEDVNPTFSKLFPYILQHIQTFCLFGRSKNRWCRQGNRLLSTQLLWDVTTQTTSPGMGSSQILQRVSIWARPGIQSQLSIGCRGWGHRKRDIKLRCEFDLGLFLEVI